MLLWATVWITLVLGLVLLDVFLFRTPATALERTRIPAGAAGHAEPLTVSWLGPPFYAGAREGLWVERMLEDRFNLELKPIFMDPNGYDRKKPLMIAGGPVPDFIWEANPLGLQKSVQHGFIAEVPLELIHRTMPVYYRELTEEAPIAWLYSIVDGRNYGVPTMSRQGAQPKPGIWRMDWLRRLGIEQPPETLEAFEEALRLISTGDPDGNGINDTYGMSGDISNWWWVAFSEIFGAYGVLPFDWQTVDGRIVWGGIRPETREVLALLRRWYEDGLIHPEFVTDNMLPGQTLDRKFLSGKTGYIYYRGEQWNLNYTSNGSIAFKLLSLQFESILAQSPGVVERLLEETPEAFLVYALSEELLNLLKDLPEELEEAILDRYESRLAERGYPPAERDDHLQRARSSLGHINETIANWIMRGGLQDRILFRELYRLNPEREKRFTPPENPDADQLYYLVLRETILQDVLSGLPRDTYTAFRQMLMTELTKRAGAPSLVLPEGGLTGTGREALAGLVTGDQLDGLLPLAWDWMQDRGILVERPPETTFRSLLLSHYGRLLYKEIMPPILEPAPFPAGPEGKRGARAWGKGGNILTFGSHVASEPDKAVRVLSMLEEMYTDRDLSRETYSGQEGLHWEWIDPVLREQGPSGLTMKVDYLDPLSGRELDLSVGPNMMRNLLNPSMSYFNLVGAAHVDKDYYSGQSGLEYRRQYQKEEWGLENALGKSDVVPSASIYLSDLRMRQQTVFAEIIRGSMPLSAFDAFVEEWKAKGGDILLAEANHLYDELQQVQENVRSHFE